ncbi:MAG TPA: prepilin-type N-terminal cleavage/methylation domain-containing protein [bacterium]|nr:prepilin-type N-terminal cleavage/methylation domain-containing protein [bacterium]
MLSAPSALRRRLWSGGDDTGFTLIELTVSVLLLALLAMVMGLYYPNASSNSGFGRNLTYATLLAQQQMEEVKTKTFSYITPTNYTGSSTFTQWGVNFTRSVTVTRCAVTVTAPCPNPITPTQSPNLTIVAVTVSWQEPSSNLPKAVTLTTTVQNYF